MIARQLAFAGLPALAALAALAAGCDRQAADLIRTRLVLPEADLPHVETAIPLDPRASVWSIDGDGRTYVDGKGMPIPDPAASEADTGEEPEASRVPFLLEVHRSLRFADLNHFLPAAMQWTANLSFVVSSAGGPARVSWPIDVRHLCGLLVLVDADSIHNEHGDPSAKAERIWLRIRVASGGVLEFSKSWHGVSTGPPITIRRLPRGAGPSDEEEPSVTAKKDKPPPEIWSLDKVATFMREAEAQGENPYVKLRVAQEIGVEDALRALAALKEVAPGRVIFEVEAPEVPY